MTYSTTKFLKYASNMTDVTALYGGRDLSMGDVTYLYGGHDLFLDKGPQIRNKYVLYSYVL